VSLKVLTTYLNYLAKTPVDKQFLLTLWEARKWQVDDDWTSFHLSQWSVDFEVKKVQKISTGGEQRQQADRSALVSNNNFESFFLNLI
jgi:hypothetical protein